MKKLKKYLLFALTGLLLCLEPDILYATAKTLFPADPYDISHYKKTLVFGSHSFKVKDSSLSETGRLGPNQNIFNPNNASVDSLGRLILKLSPKNGLWQAAEVISTDHFGYGTYTFKVASKIDQLDPHVTFSIFLYEDDQHEIDIEFSDFGTYNSQFIIQPYDVPDHMSLYTSKLNGAYTSYVIDYQPHYVKFEAYHGHDTQNKNNLIHDWRYTGDDIPLPTKMRLRFNLYIRHTSAPINLQAQQIIISDFTYQLS